MKKYFALSLPLKKIKKRKINVSLEIKVIKKVNLSLWLSPFKCQIRLFLKSSSRHLFPHVTITYMLNAYL